LDSFVTIARILKTRGVRGEVAAELLTDFPERFSSVSRVHVRCGGRAYQEEIEQYRFFRDKIILKFSGRDSPEEAVPLLGGLIQLPEQERAPLPPDTYYHYDLIGCRVEENGVRLGAVTGVFEVGAGVVNLEVVTEDGREAMIPLVHHFVQGVDVERKVIKVKLPPGLI
jgi:16S rRNA processing protein RimM